MKVFCIALIFSFYCLHGMAQSRFEIIAERPQEKSLIGFLSKDILQTDSTFGWFQENYKAYQPYNAALVTCKQYRDSIQILAFMGTWCDDSHFVIPRLYALASQAELDEKRIVLLGVNRKKETWGDLTKTFGVVNVPTLIVLRDGKEIGRVVEYGKYGQFDRELGEIIQQSFSRPR